MRILHVIDRVGIEYGGSAVVPRKLTKALADLGNDVITYASDAGVNSGVPDVANLRTFKTWVTYAGTIHLTPSMLFADFGNFDIIHCHNYYTFQNLIARLKNIHVPMVLQPHGSFVMYSGLLKKRPTQQIIDGPWRRLFLNRMDRIICVSNIEIQQAIDLGFNRVALIPNGIDMDEYAALPPYGDFRRKYNIPDDAKVILNIGRQHWLKGIADLMDAYIKIKNSKTRLVLVGADQEGEYDSVIQIPSLYGVDKLSAYVDADLFVLPSKYEIFGITPLEAMACGTPALITDKCGLADYCSGEIGEPAITKIEDLALSIDYHLYNPDKDKYQTERWEFVERFRWDRVATEFEAVYRYVIKESLCRRG